MNIQHLRRAVMTAVVFVFALAVSGVSGERALAVELYVPRDHTLEEASHMARDGDVIILTGDVDGGVKFSLGDTDGGALTIKSDDPQSPRTISDYLGFYSETDETYIDVNLTLENVMIETEENTAIVVGGGSVRVGDTCRLNAPYYPIYSYRQLELRVDHGAQLIIETGGYGICTIGKLSLTLEEHASMRVIGEDCNLEAYVGIYGAGGADIQLKEGASLDIDADENLYGMYTMPNTELTVSLGENGAMHIGTTGVTQGNSTGIYGGGGLTAELGKGAVLDVVIQGYGVRADGNLVLRMDEQATLRIDIASQTDVSDHGIFATRNLDIKLGAGALLDIDIATKTGTYCNGINSNGNDSKLTVASGAVVDIAFENQGVGSTVGIYGESHNIVVDLAPGAVVKMFPCDYGISTHQGGDITVQGDPALFLIQGNDIAFRAYGGNPSGTVATRLSGRIIGDTNEPCFAAVGTPEVSPSGLNPGTIQTSTRHVLLQLTDYIPLEGVMITLEYSKDNWQTYDSEAFPLDAKTGQIDVANILTVAGTYAFRVKQTIEIDGQTYDSGFSTQPASLTVHRDGGTGATYHDVTFDSQGGSAVQSQRIQSGQRAAEPVPPVKAGYTFTGWYTTADCGEKYDFDRKVTGSFTLYAGWVGSESGVNAPYIQGYPDGTFKPDGEISRAEAAKMLHSLERGEVIIPRTDTKGGEDFTDVTAGTWYYDAVTELARAGVFNGYPDGRFKPEGHITRAEFTTMIVRYMGLEASDSSDFPDVPADYWASGYIAAAREAGLVDGYPDGSFGPDDQLTRGQAVTIINRMLGRGADKAQLADLEMPFTDVAPGHWAYWQIMAAAVAHEK